ncbi:S16 family serine protease, partial [Acinetobacter baumannii]
VKTVLFPRANEKDLPEIPDYVRKRIEMIPVAHLDEVFAIAFKSALKPPVQSRNGKGARSIRVERSASKSRRNDDDD